MTDFARAPDGTRIAFEREGSGPTVLLIHGFSANRTSWWSNGWAPALVAAGRRVIAIDLRGHGESDKPRDAEAYGDRMFDDIAAVLDAADAPVTDIVAYSMGSIVAIGFLKARPERVRRAVLGGIGTSYFGGNHLIGRSIVAALETDNPATITDPIDRLHRHLATRNGNDRFALAALLRGGHRIYPPAELADVVQPMLVVCGGEDHITGAPMPLAEAFPNGRALTLAGHDHVTALDCPQFQTAAITFLTAR